MIPEPVIEPPLIARTESVALPPAPAPVVETKTSPPPLAPKEPETIQIAANVNTMPKDPLAALREGLKANRPRLDDVNVTGGEERKISVTLVKTSF